MKNVATISGMSADALRGAIFFLTALFFVSSADAPAQAITVNGGNLSMTITAGVAGGEPTPVTNTVVTIDFRRQTAISKITVQTSCPGQKFNLNVVATTSEVGSPAASVNLVNGMLATDFITSIPVKPPNKAFTATVQYTASSTFSQGNSTELGNDIHTVTYTLVAQ
ncbi:MAG: hypothetical protein A2X67_08345 [Ignavibacteria bacterium GWA2_55_11]|nr:MAG: hypothetical protein A2X67_08345 [Ignavibacteria bacterium GWA2_55_11]OGU63345.1 MAG: hypothetical protein A3C56_12930 [Ignavibacteria bacterium RIFCSPHIGHO2_02_FULL_56_12]OGU69585.1 MAG: hypothetical protein A3H45_08040 [Ignavibacteria bacterium RIFCSPLOWO2_02_FULL_55_14]OGU71484.1 MAG: hypothetical protein A3G43_02470 [Ignavibacteria bacterium RIFCSPLOWO2_12_FULL_56_21]HAV22085.1 hypothetical protein [Bacteroidota bacterium]